MNNNESIEKNIDQFLHTLQNRKSDPSFSLYSDNKSGSNVYEEVKVKDVMKTISKQIVAIRNADNITKNQRRNGTLSIHKKCEFVPLTLIPVETPIDTENEFETQCFLDTQLIDFVKKAEELVQDEKKERNDVQKHNKCPANKNGDENIAYLKESDDNILREVDTVPEYVTNQYFIKPDVTYDEDDNRVDNDNVILDTDNELDVKKLEDQKSPILGNAKAIFKHPLVCTLADFNNFETLAAPVLKEISDFNDAKCIINSQLKAQKLFRQTHAESVVYDRDKQNTKENDFREIKNMEGGENIRTQYSFDVKPSQINVIEDKMLFDSDDDYEDLPSTCPMETSFHNEADVLDRTLYVGFQTASNQSIQVLADTFKMAQGVFDDVSKKVSNVSVTELVDVTDMISLNECHLNKDEAGSKIDLKNSKDEKIIGKEGFVDACNICESLVDTKNKSDEFENDLNVNKSYNNISDHIDEHLMKEFEDIVMPGECDALENTDVQEKRNLDDNYFDALDDNDNSIKEVKKDNNKDINSSSVGFKTASDKIIRISEQAISRSKNIFDDINIENDLIINPPVSKSTNEKNAFIGFKTANNQIITVSDQAMLKTKNIFDNIDDQKLNKCENKSKSLQKEFTTTDCERSVSFPLIETNLDSSRNKTKQFEGFKTASNKSVYISKNALEKSKKVFQDIEKSEKENLGDGLDFDKFKTTHEKPPKISKNALDIPKNKLKDIVENMEENKKGFNNATCEDTYKVQTPIFKGFATASNKPVTISVEALRKSKKIFEDITESECMPKRNVACVDDNTVQSTSKTELNYLATSEKSAKDLSKFGHIESFKEFQTASNKKVEISEDALLKSNKVFENINDKNKENCSVNSFVGFQTASNKRVKISEEALTKSKEVFRNVEDEHEKGGFIGFQTANKKRVKISEDALLKSKKIFEDIDLNTVEENRVNINGFGIASNKNADKSEASLKVKEIINGLHDERDYDELKSQIKTKLKTTVNKIDAKNTDNKEILPVKHNNGTDHPINIEDLFNTEVIRNFDESLHTEGFIKETPKSKRSGSPILSCPRPKKKKFEPPKSINRNVKNDYKIPKAVHIHKFDEHYKKTRKFKLKELLRDNWKKSNDIDPYILRFNFETLLDFRFQDRRNDIDSDIWGTDKIKKYFTDCVNGKIVPDGWIENHMRLIIWKLISYEIFFGDSFKYVCSLKNIMQQLKYRYDRELYNVERPALRKIMEKDDVSTKLIVLCVACLYIDGVSVKSVTKQTKNIELLLTDGWYCIKASTDRMLEKLIIDGKIAVGTKLAIHGAELMNCDQGISPWEDTNAVRLKISGNSTKRAHWDARLGYHGNGAMLTKLSAVKLDGGKVSKLRVLVTRVYPTLYVEKFNDGSTVTRSERLEHLHQVKYETERQVQMEKLYDEVERITEQESQDSEQTQQDDLDTGSQISRLIKRSKDPIEFKATLTSTQIQRLNEHTHKEKEILIQKMQNKVRDLMKKRGLDVMRNVVPLLKVRVADVGASISKATITIWRPNDSLLELIHEGAWVDIYNAVPTSIRYSEIQISAGRQSIFCKKKFNETDKQKTLKQTLKRKSYTIKALQCSLASDYNEVDTFGIVFLIEPVNFDGNKQLFQNAYISGIDKNIITINFWGGIKKFGFDNIIDIGEVIACVNIQKRAGNTRSIPQYRATELSYFTKTPKYESLKVNMDDLITKFIKMDKIKFIQDCIALKNNYCNFKYDVSPYRLNNSEYNISKNKIFIDSPLNRDLNLSGLDFESSFREELSPNTLRKRKVNEKIEKLKIYGEPPPLNPIHIINKAVITPYKSPLICNGVSKTVNVNSNSVTSNKMSSPILNRTFVKINPIKLNFAMEDNNDELESPPLSLDNS